MFYIQQLRKATGSPIKHCKTALEESGGNLVKAEEWLRLKGISQASKKFDNVVSAGLIGVRVKDNHAVLIEGLCETDFVARSDIFQNFLKACLDSAPNSATLNELNDTLLKSPLDSSLASQTIKEAAVFSISKLQENIKIRRYATVLGTTTSVVSHYVHNALAPGLGSSAAVIRLSSTSPVEAHRDYLTELGSKLCMHIVAAKPKFISKESVPVPEIIKESEAIHEQLKDLLANKKKKVAESMVAGRLQKYFETICLEEQSFMISQDDEDIKIKEVLKKAGKEIDATIKIDEYLAFRVGEEVA